MPIDVNTMVRFNKLTTGFRLVQRRSKAENCNFGSLPLSKSLSLSLSLSLAYTHTHVHTYTYTHIHTCVEGPRGNERRFHRCGPSEAPNCFSTAFQYFESDAWSFSGGTLLAG